jgi:hypothetical protein
MLAGVLAAGAAMPAAGQVFIGLQGTSSQHANWGIGPRVMVELGPLDFGFRLAGSFEIFFPNATTFERSGVPVLADDVDYWEANFNVHYTFGIPIVTPYVGGGLNLAGTKIEGSLDGTFDVDETKTGVNTLVGVEAKVFGIAPYLEGRKSFGGGDQWMVTLGFTFR